MSTEQPIGKVIAHIDLDAFYASVEGVRDPARLAGKPVGVVQYNPYGDLRSLTPDDDRLVNSSNSSLIAVNYAARDAGVKRNMSGGEARKLCPELMLVQVPTAHGKADLTLYRDEGKKVLDVLSRLGVCERSSIDECALDVTAEAARRLAASGGAPPMPLRRDQVHVCGAEDAAAWWGRPAEEWGPGEALLACGASAVAEARSAVEAELGYTCSAGIAHTRLLAKLCCGLNKPRQQTVAPAAEVPALLAPLPLASLRGLGAKFGQQVCEDLGLETVGQLAAVPLSRLEAKYGDKDARWLYQLARGIDDAAVADRRLPKSVSCGKTFRGAWALGDAAEVHKWLLELARELEERLAADKADNGRTPQLLTVSVVAGGRGTGVSRSCSLRRTEATTMADDAAALVKRWVAEQGAGWLITDMSLAAGNFAPLTGTSAITKFFKPAASPPKAPSARVQGDGEAAAAEAAVAGQPAASTGAVAAPVVAKSVRRENTDAPGTSGSGSKSGAHRIDESVMAQLPEDIQKEIRAQMEVNAMAAAGMQQFVGVKSVHPGIANGARSRSSGGEQIDESVLAQLPKDIQKEIRAQMEYDAMAARAAQQAPGGRGKRRGGGTVTTTLDAYLKGKRPKR